MDPVTIYFGIGVILFVVMYFASEAEINSDVGMGLTALMIIPAWPLFLLLILVALLFDRKTYYHIRRFFWKTDAEIEQDANPIIEVKSLEDMREDEWLSSRSQKYSQPYSSDFYYDGYSTPSYWSDRNG